MAINEYRIKERITVTIDDDALVRLDAIAEAQRLDRSTLLNRIVCEAVGLSRQWKLNVRTVGCAKGA